MNAKKRKTMKKTGNYIVRYFFVIIWMIIALLPIYVAVMTSFTPFEKLGEAMILPKYFRWENYVELARQTPLWQYLAASIIYALGTSLFTVVIAILAAYALSRFKFKFKIPFLMIIVAIQVVPQIVIVTPLFHRVI